MAGFRKYQYIINMQEKSDEMKRDGENKVLIKSTQMTMATTCHLIL